MGYRGTFCDVLSTTCRSVIDTEPLGNNYTELVCLNAGVCKQVGSTFMCACVLGYGGDNCQQGELLFHRTSVKFRDLI